MPDPRPGSSERTRRIVLLATTGALLMVLLDSTIVGVILPRVQRDLDLGATGLQWVANAYLLALAALMPLGGRLADLIDDRIALAIGSVVFTAASAVAGTAGSGTELIVARAVQGAGAALMTPASLALVMATFPPERRARALGLRTSVSTAGLPLGTLLAGIATEFLTWRLVFLINVPIGALIVLVLRWAPSARPTGDRPGFDVLGATTLVGGLAAVVLGLMQSAVWGITAPATLALLAAGVVALALFTVHSLRISEPLLDLRLLGRRRFMGTAVIGSLHQFGLIGVSVFGAILLQDLVGLSPLQAGLAILPTALGITVVSPIAARLYERIGIRPLAVAGTLLSAAALLWTAATLEELDYLVLAPAYLAIGIGVGLVNAPANVFALSQLPHELRGQGAGVLQTLRQIGGTFGLAVIGTVVTTIQYERLDASLHTYGVSRASIVGIERLLSEDNATQATIAAQVPGAEATAVVDLTVDAIGGAFVLGYVTAGGVLLFGLVVAFWTLPRGRLSGLRRRGDAPRDPAEGVAR